MFNSLHPLSIKNRDGKPFHGFLNKPHWGCQRRTGDTISRRHAIALGIECSSSLNPAWKKMVRRKVLWPHTCHHAPPWSSYGFKLSWHIHIHMPKMAVTQEDPSSLVWTTESRWASNKGRPQTLLPCTYKEKAIIVFEPWKKMENQLSLQFLLCHSLGAGNEQVHKNVIHIENITPQSKLHGFRMAILGT